MTSLLTYAALVGLFGLVGLVLGAAQFASLSVNVRLYTGMASRGVAAGFHFARLVLAVAAWLAVARFGHALGLLGAFAGFLVARPLVTACLRRSRS